MHCYKQHNVIIIVKLCTHETQPRSRPQPGSGLARRSCQKLSLMKSHKSALLPRPPKKKSMRQIPSKESDSCAWAAATQRGVAVHDQHQ